MTSLEETLTQLWWQSLASGRRNKTRKEAPSYHYKSQRPHTGVTAEVEVTVALLQSFRPLRFPSAVAVV